MDLLLYEDSGDVLVLYAGEDINADNACGLNEEIGQRIDDGF